MTKLFPFFSSCIVVMMFGCSDASSDYGNVDSGSSSSLTPTYANGIKTIMTKYNCSGCHPTYASLSGVQSNYSIIMDSIDGINGRKKMPSGGGSVSTSDRDILVKWTSPNSPYGQYAP